MGAGVRRLGSDEEGQPLSVESFIEALAAKDALAELQVWHLLTSCTRSRRGIGHIFLPRLLNCHWDFVGLRLKIPADQALNASICICMLLDTVSFYPGKEWKEGYLPLQLKLPQP